MVLKENMVWAVRFAVVLYRLQTAKGKGEGLTLTAQEVRDIHQGFRTLAGAAKREEQDR